MPLLGAIAGMPLLGAMAGCHHCWMLAEFTIAGCHCWGGIAGPCWGAIAGVPLLDHCWGAIAGCHCSVPLLGAIARCHCWGAIASAIAGCHCWVPFLCAIAGVPLLGAIVRCHGWMSTLLDASGVHDCWMPCWGAIARKIDQSVTPFSAAPFSTLITHKLACAIWGLCWYNFSLEYIPS